MAQETLFFKKRLTSDEGSLQDARGNHLGWFASFEAAKAWCEENGYRIRQ